VTLSMVSNDQPLTMPCSESDFAIGPAFDAVDIGIIVLDRRECIVAWNDWMARVSRHDKSAVLGKSLYEVFPSLRDTRLPAVIGDSFQSGSSSVLTHTLNKLLPLRGDGGHKLLHNLVVRPVSSGRSDFCLLQINDVTVSAMRERVLRDRQNARYHAIVDSAPDAIITTDIDRTIQWINGAAEHVFGYAAADLLGKKIDVLLAHEGSLSRIFSDQTCMPDKALQVVGRRTNGSPGYFDVSFGRWRADERVFVTTIWRDVTERMAADVALRDSESRHRALLEALPQLVWTCGADGACDYCNLRWQDYTGASADQHLGWEWLKVVHEGDREGLEAVWRASLTTESVFDADARLRRADGEYRWFKMRSIPVHGVGGAVTRWLGTATDITDHIEARDALRSSNEELELRVAERTREREVALRQLHESQKMESIGQLTGGVAHDFNNLLAVILGSLALLKKAIPEGSRATALLERAVQGAERGATLTARLLAFARRQELKFEVVGLQELIPDMLDFLRHSVGPTISVGVDIPPEVHPVEVDANQLELALMNLAVNARDAMPQGGTLVITCRNGTGSQANGLPRGDYIQICVADNGEGMNEATLSRAKEPFFTTKGIGKGTGLGLSMVHGFAAQSRGAMDIASEPGKGTVVTLWLPRAQGIAPPKSEKKEKTPAQGTTARKLRVLLVDDDILVSMGAADMLIDLGHSVAEAQSAVHAFNLLETQSPFDVVVTDYAMPGMNGYDFAVRLRQTHPRLPVVLATGYAELPTKTATEFRRLAKPYSQADLAAALELAVSKNC
jgi:PAS domain S-box-containing protein